MKEQQKQPETDPEIRRTDGGGQRKWGWWTG